MKAVFLLLHRLLNLIKCSCSSGVLDGWGRAVMEVGFPPLCPQHCTLPAGGLWASEGGAEDLALLQAMLCSSAWVTDQHQHQHPHQGAG